ncbi:oligosaccharide flippase family protein [Sinomonas flava]|uniref:oligosaccharide flippase family protein n=1 Tax=Sinomonas flava TaxID=496857 RepID=UPI0039A583EF
MLRADSRTADPRRVARGALWSGVNTLITKLATIAVTIFVLRIVSPQDFGTFAVALVVYTVVSSCSELGLSASIARRDLDPREIAPAVVVLSICSSLILSAAMFASAGPLASMLGAPGAADSIRILSLSILFSCLTTVPTAMLTREFRQGRIFTATAVAFVPSNALLIILALSGEGAVAFAWSRLAGQVFAGAVVIASVRPWFWPRWNREPVQRALAFGLPLAGANLLNYTLLNADYAFIGGLLGPVLLGVYTLAFNIASWSTSILGAAINGVGMPAFSVVKDQPELVGEKAAHWLAVVGLVAFPMSALTAVLAPDIVHVLYGEKWSAAGPVLSALAVYGGVFVVSLVASNILVGTGHAGWVFIIQAVWLGFLVPAVVLGVSAFGLLGAAYAHVAVICVVVIPVYGCALRRVMTSPWRTCAEPLTRPIAAALAGASVAALTSLILPVGLPRLLGAGLLGVVAVAFAARQEILRRVPVRALQRLAPKGGRHVQTAVLEGRK